MTTILTRVRERLECRRVARRLQSYIDGELPLTDAAPIAAHLSACGRCGLDEQAYLDLIANLAALSASVDPHAVDRLRVFVDQIDAAAG